MDHPRPPITRKTVTWRGIMFFMHLAYFFLWPTRVHGRGNVPRAGPVLLVANHQSFLDIPLLAKGVRRRHVAFVARHTLAHSRLLGFVLRRTGAILIHRSAGHSGLRRVRQHLQAGDAVAVFPEGTRSRDGRLGTPKKGLLVAARGTGARIIPCAIRGSHEAWPPTARWPRPGRLEVRFAAPIDSGQPDALERTWSVITEMLSAPQPTGASAGIHPDRT